MYRRYIVYLAQLISSKEGSIECILNAELIRFARWWGGGEEWGGGGGVRGGGGEDGWHTLHLGPRKDGPVSLLTSKI